jgi:hypothetical protein
MLALCETLIAGGDCLDDVALLRAGAPLIASVRSRIAEIGEGDWQRSSYREGSQVASIRWRPKTWERERRFIVRRDPAEIGEQLSLEGREWHCNIASTPASRFPVATQVGALAGRSRGCSCPVDVSATTWFLPRCLAS